MYDIKVKCLRTVEQWPACPIGRDIACRIFEARTTLKHKLNQRNERLYRIKNQVKTKLTQ